MKGKKEIRLYDMIFPIWLIWLFPMSLAAVLPANFIWDMLMLLIIMKCLKIENPWREVKKAVVRTWAFGLLADLISSAFLFLLMSAEPEGHTAIGKLIGDGIYGATYDPFANVLSFLFVTIAVAIAALCIYCFNIKFALKKVAAAEAEKKRISLFISLTTAPYLFYLPLDCLLGGYFSG